MHGTHRRQGKEVSVAPLPILSILTDIDGLQGQKDVGMIANISLLSYAKGNGS